MKLRVTLEDQTFEVEVGDLNARPIQATIEGETFEVWPEENGKATPQAVSAAVPLVPSAVSSSAAAVPSGADRAKAVLAPIPGVILSITVKAGDTVTFGQELCILEAMKMKNILRASRAGKIGAVRVSPGDQVRHSQVLMEYAD